MSNPEDFAQGDITRSYCRYCARPDGSMQSYDEKLVSLAGFLAKTQGLEPSIATTTAEDIMSRLPAWRDRKAARQAPSGQARPAQADPASVKQPL
jgi:hypothetical protein